MFFIAVYLTPPFAFIAFAFLIMGSTLLKDVFDYEDCPADFPTPCTKDERFCCKDAFKDIEKTNRPIAANHFWIFAMSIPAALTIIIIACYNRKLSFHPILSDHVNVGLHKIRFEIASYK